MSDTTFFDIETGQEAPDVLAQYEPEFSAPSNWKDPEKIAADIARQRAEWTERAALSPLTGRILAIGYRYAGTSWIDDGTEAEIIGAFFQTYEEARAAIRRPLCGFAIHSFDLPFICRRALHLNIAIPPSLLPTGRGRFYWPDHLIDLRTIWGMGEHQPAGSLDAVARFLSVGQKNGKGGDFARLFHGTPAQREQALDYLRNDLALLAGVGARFGLK